MSTRRVATLLAAMCLLVAAGTARAGDKDRDGDGMPDSWEKAHGLDPDDPSDASEDPDDDDLDNRAEFAYGGDPHAADTDGDGLKDGAEVTRWRSRVDAPDRIIGRVGVTGRCRSGGDDCREKYLFRVTVVLYDSRERQVALTRTVSNGRFTFGNQDDGRYEVDAVAVAGTTARAPVNVRVEAGQKSPARAALTLDTVPGRGVAGQATQGPTCPAQREGDECVAALDRAPITVKDAAGNVVARVETDEDGYYYFRLDPGDYKLVAGRIDGASHPLPPRRKRFSVRQEDGGPQVINSSYDTGIR